MTNHSHLSYEELIKSCRQGINLTLEEIHDINIYNIHHILTFFD